MGRMVRWSAAGSGTPEGVTLGAVSPRIGLTNNVVTSWLASAGKGFTPQTGDALALVAFLDNGRDVAPIALTIGGTSVVVREMVDANHGGQYRGCGLLLGTVRGLPTGTPLDAVLTTGGVNGVGRVAAWFIDLSGWGGSVGNHDAVLLTGGQAVSQASVSIAVTHAGSLIIGLACVAAADTAPLVADGWTRFASATVATPAGSSTAAACFVRSGDVAEAAADFVVVGDLGWSDWAVGILELF